jgi:hypothetical protein
MSITSNHTAVSPERAESAETAARLEAMRRGGLVIGTGIGGNQQSPYIVVYVTNKSMPHALSEPFEIWGNIPVVTMQIETPSIL